MKRSIQISGSFLFLVYIAGLVYFLFFAEGYGRGADGAVYSCNLLPFHEILRYIKYRSVLGHRAVMLNLLGNIIGFVPFGAFLSMLSENVRSAWKITLLSLEISLLVELVQLIFHVGCFDVDDMILNSLGGLLGFFIFQAVYTMWKKFLRR